MINKPIEAIAAEDIRSLIDNRAPEGRGLDYKEQLPSGGDEARRDFLADVASFANTADGDLLFGVSEERDVDKRPTGIPAEAVGVGGNLDAEILKLDNAVRDGIEPRISGLRWQAVPGFREGPVLVCRIQKSWQAPHMVTFKNLCRFYARGASGKYQLDVPQIRAAFISSATLRDNIRRFRQDRLARIRGDETPVHLYSASRLVMHLAPLAGFDASGPGVAGIDLSNAHPLPLYGGVDGYRYNFDGILGYVAASDRRPLGYVQVFRNGAIEAVDTVIFKEESKTIPSTAFERQVILALSRYLKDLGDWRVTGPILVMLSLIDVAGYRMAVRDRFLLRPDEPGPIDRDVLVVPEMWLEEIPASPTGELAASLLRASLDVVWQAAGWAQSVNFNEKGEWKPL